MFDRNRVGQQRNTISQEVRRSEIGTVTKVFEHVGKNDTSNFEANVRIEGGADDESKIPIEMGGAGITVPKVGSKVRVGYRDDGKEAFVSGLAYSTINRPPVARAGVFRREFSSGQTPAGGGNLYLSGNTTYDGNPALDNFNSMSPKRTVIRMSKRSGDVPDPNLERDVPAKLEFYDSSEEDKSFISVELNKYDKSSSDATWGGKFDMKEGTWQLVDRKGFGIKAHGDGTFTWHIKKEEGAMNFKEHDSDTGPLNL